MYLALFASAFLAATLFPAQSEAALLALLASEHYSPAALLFAASLGNILGSCLNWAIGLHLQRFRHHRLFPFSARQMDKAERFYRRYGVYTLLLSWMPIIGDPLTLIAGILRERFWRFLLLVSLAKTGRYLFLYALYRQLSN